MYSIGCRSPPEHIDFYWKWGQKFKCGWAKLGGPGVVPCGFYADEAAFKSGPPQQKVLAMYLNFCLFRPASIRHSRFLVFAIHSAYMLGPETLYPVLAKLVESFHWAFLGRRPNGTPLCEDGTRFLITEMRGDLDWLKTCWKFEKRGWSSQDVCFFCEAKAQGPDYPYTEVGCDAKWNETEFSNVWDWAAKVLPEKICSFGKLARLVHFLYF